MISTVIEIIATLLLVAIDIVIALLFSEAINSLLQKNRLWVGFIGTVMGIIMLQAAVYSWLPGRLGYAVQLFDGLITLEDGATLSNLGALLLVQALAIAILLGKNIWSVIRKKAKFHGKYFALELLFMFLFGFAGTQLFENEKMIALSKEPTIHSNILISLFICGFLLVIFGIRFIRRKENYAKHGERQGGG